jgi:flagellin
MPPYIQGGIFMIIQHNMSAMNANRQLGVTQGNLQKSTEKLSSGYRINRAGDDAAGLAISEKMRGQIRGLDQASTNAEDGISLVQTAEGALQETQNILQRMRELAVQASNDTNTDDDRTQIQKEITQLTNEVDRIATTSEFNTKKLLDGSVTGAKSREYGSSEINGSFTNGLVTVGNSANSNYTAVDGVVRLVAKQDITDSGNLSNDVFDITQIGTDNEVTVEEGSIKIADGQYATDSSLVSSTEDPDGGELEFSLEMNGGTIKAGDVITISLKAAQKSASAEDGKESLRLQVGANAAQEIQLGINSMKANDLHIVQGDGTALDVTSQGEASKAIEAYDMALQTVSTERAKLGAVQNRLEHTISNLDTSSENLQSAESRIRDVDMADEMTSYSKSNILQQAGTSMLAQANQSNQTVLSLLQ